MESERTVARSERLIARWPSLTGRAAPDALVVCPAGPWFRGAHCLQPASELGPAPTQARSAATRPRVAPGPPRAAASPELAAQFLCLLRVCAIRLRIPAARP